MTRRGFLESTMVAAGAYAAVPARGKLRAGVAAANITPALGAPLAGSFTEGRATEVHDELWVRSIVLDNGHTRIAIAQVDTCVMQASIIHEAKRLIAVEAGIPAAQVLICATHSHSAPAALPVFQARPDPKYLEWLTRRIADAVRMAGSRLQAAKLGYGFGREERLVFNRRYYMKPGTVPPNPFGGIDGVKTNPGIRNPDVIKPAGPVDPTVGVLSIQTEAGRPLAIVGNYSLHYVGGVGPGHVSADYFAYWGAEMERRAGVTRGLGDPPFVAMLLNGAQGDINNVDVMNGSKERQAPYVQMAHVADVLANESERVLKSVAHSAEVELGSSEEWLDLAVRLPSAEDVRAAKKLLDAAPKGQQHREMPLVYAHETVAMAETYPKVERVPVQALRIGGLAIAALPGEPFVELGLELRQKSPVRSLFVAGLSNDHVGYVPTPEAHEQRGYETWRAKTSYLDEQAAPRIVASMLKRLQALA